MNTVEDVGDCLNGTREVLGLLKRRLPSVETVLNVSCLLAHHMAEPPPSVVVQVGTAASGGTTHPCAEPPIPVLHSTYWESVFFLQR